MAGRAVGEVRARLEEMAAAAAAAQADGAPPVREQGLDQRAFRRLVHVTAIEQIERRCTAELVGQMSLAEVREWRATLDRNFDLFTNEQLNVNQLANGQMAAEADIFWRVEEMVIRIRATIGTRIDELAQGREVPREQPQPIRVEVSTTDLPSNQNTWGKFDGDLVKWQSFRDKFTAAVHENERIKPVFKLQHLLAALTGEAAAVVGTRPPTEAGYQGAWERLGEVFNDESQIIRAILRAFTAMPKITRPTHTNMRALVDTTHETVRQLEALGVGVEHWDQRLVFDLTERLDNETLNAWDMHRASNFPTLQELCAFLERKARSLPWDDPPAEQAKAGQKRRHNGETVKQEQAHNKPHAASTGAPLKPSSGHAPCQSCGGGHALYRCPTFLGMALAARRRAAAEWKCCFNCLRTGHEAAQCTFGACSRCPGNRKHNSLLCPMREASGATVALAVSKKSKKKKQKPAPAKLEAE